MPTVRFRLAQISPVRAKNGRKINLRRRSICVRPFSRDRAISQMQKRRMSYFLVSCYVYDLTRLMTVPVVGLIRINVSRPRKKKTFFLRKRQDASWEVRRRGRCVCKWLLQLLVHFSFFPEPRTPRVPSSVFPPKGKSGLASCAHNLVGKRGVCRAKPAPSPPFCLLRHKGASH